MAEQATGTVGLILAGGRSSRFGADKAAAELGGDSLLHRALLRLAPSCARVAVSAPDGSDAARLAGELGLDVVVDVASSARGPLAGVAAGLLWARHAGAELMAALPCDVPLAPDDLIPRLLASLGPDDGAAVARTADGLQSLCLVARVGVVDGLVETLAQGHHPPVHEWLADIRACEVAFADGEAFLNVNTPEDLGRAESLHPI